MEVRVLGPLEVIDGQLFSPRMGCQTFQPLYFGVDIAALCMHDRD
jgi:hypothetical protein